MSESKSYSERNDQPTVRVLKVIDVNDTPSSLLTKITFSVAGDQYSFNLLGLRVQHGATVPCMGPVNHLFFHGPLWLARVKNKLLCCVLYFDLCFILVVGLNGLIWKAFGLSKAVGKLIFSFKRAHIPRCAI